KDVPATDVNTNPQIMAWMYDEYSKIRGFSSLAAFTGKPVIIGGSLGREISTAYGGVVILENFLARFEVFKSKEKKDISVAIQGFGNVGGNIAKLLYERGYKIVAVSDSRDALYDPKGLDIKEITETQKEKGRLITKTCYPADLAELGMPCSIIANEELLKLDVDILIPAAIENQIHEENADEIKARVILEMANGPVTREASVKLRKKDIVIIPDIIANAGGVIGSYYEWVQNHTGLKWEEREVLENIKKKMDKAFEDVYRVSKEFNVDLRCGAYIKVLKKIEEALKLLGRI
ncbi:MAG: Glu/Leu/Phe/Val dehydrogenase, partial [Candidatus Margulisiibacteriota bacterium]